MSHNINKTIDSISLNRNQTNSQLRLQTINLQIETITQFQQDALQSKVLNCTQKQSDNGHENHSPSNKSANPLKAMGNNVGMTSKFWFWLGVLNS